MKLLLVNPNISDSVTELIRSEAQRFARHPNQVLTAPFGVASAVRHAETLVALLPGSAQRGSFAPPPLKPNRGLPPDIVRLLDRTA